MNKCSTYLGVCLSEYLPVEAILTSWGALRRSLYGVVLAFFRGSPREK